MWFKNLQIYRFNKSFELDAETLGQHLQQEAFVPCGSQDESRSGWVAPLGRDGSELTHATNGYLMICLKREDKLLPAGVINEALEQKAGDIELREGRRLPRKERREMRDEIFHGLLPRAFSRSRLLYAYISPRDGLLIVDSATASRAEELLQKLRDALGSLPVTPLSTRRAPIDVMTRWIETANPTGRFELGDVCELRDNADISSVIRCKHQDLSATEIVSHVKSGMHASKLALAWNERVDFVLDEHFIVRRLRFTDIVLDQANDGDTDDAATRFDTDFAIMSLEISALVEALLAAFGGADSDEDTQ